MKRILIDVLLILLIIGVWFVGSHLYIDHQNLHELVRVEQARRTTLQGK